MLWLKVGTIFSPHNALVKCGDLKANEFYEVGRFLCVRTVQPIRTSSANVKPVESIRRPSHPSVLELTLLHRLRTTSSANLRVGPSNGCG